MIKALLALTTMTALVGCSKEDELDMTLHDNYETTYLSSSNLSTKNNDLVHVELKQAVGEIVDTNNSTYFSTAKLDEKDKEVLLQTTTLVESIEGELEQYLGLREKDILYRDENRIVSKTKYLEELSEGGPYLYIDSDKVLGYLQTHYNDILISRSKDLDVEAMNMYEDKDSLVRFEVPHEVMSLIRLPEEMESEMLTEYVENSDSNLKVTSNRYVADYSTVYDNLLFLIDEYSEGGDIEVMVGKDNAYHIFETPHSLHYIRQVNFNTVDVMQQFKKDANGEFELTMKLAEQHPEI